MVEAKPTHEDGQSPSLDIPTSRNTVTVRVIDTTTEMILGVGNIVNPRITGHTEFVFPSYSFLVEHEPSGRKALFDLGVQKNWEQQAPMIIDRIKNNRWSVKVEKDVVDILEENGYRGAQIEAVIWSHYHWDHLGNPSRFPSSTAIVVGPGFKERFFPGGNAVPNSPIKEEYYQGRELREITTKDFSMNIAGFGAFDYFGDGSFYLLDTPGHATGHLCGLARTTQDTFIFMGGDIAHHCGEFRPSNHHPMPSKIFPNPLDLSSVLPCPGSLFTSIHPDGRSDTPYYRIGTWPDGSTAADDLQEAEKSLKKLEVYDAKADQVFVVLAHDPAMRGVIDFFPNDVNRWREKGWGEKTRWAFLRDFKDAIQFPGRIDQR